MKSLYLIFCCIGIVIADETFRIQTRADLLSYRTLCVDQYQIPENLVNLFKQWKFPNDETSQCYVKCVFSHMQLFDDTNGFNVDNIMTQLGSEAKRDEIINCTTRDGDENACSWAYRGFTCFEETHGDLVKKSVLRS